jgi:hypothetical protein
LLPLQRYVRDPESRNQKVTAKSCASCSCLRNDGVQSLAEQREAASTLKQLQQRAQQHAAVQSNADSRAATSC